QECKMACIKNNCIEGCQTEKPYFCENDEIKMDCTGGDRVVGNWNDCGCPRGEECNRDGSCSKVIKVSEHWAKKPCLNGGYKWCEEDGVCVSDCFLCPFESKENKNLCVDACENVTCGEHSSCQGGECLCDEDYYDDECKAFNQNIDYEKDGCVKRAPCNESKNDNSAWYILGAFFVIILFALLKRISKKPEKQKSEIPAWQQYPPGGFNRPPY
ncbi:hypothetical protein N9934_01555, partial [Desulfosarcina sp.]|nr:hypothetical protein [Desulfosarcina sp.]